MGLPAKCRLTSKTGVFFECRNHLDLGKSFLSPYVWRVGGQNDWNIEHNAAFLLYYIEVRYTDLFIFIVFHDINRALRVFRISRVSVC